MAKISQTMISQILSGVGGPSNVIQCGNCMTRLRLSLVNNDAVDQAAIKQIPGVMGVVDSHEQLQIILGPGKAQQAAELMNQLIDSITHGTALPIDEAPGSEDLSAIAATQKKQMKSKQTSAVQRFLSKFANIFTPLIPGFIAAGLLLGFATLLDQVYVLGQSPSQFMLELTAYMKVFSKGLFAFLSILIGYNAQREFGGSGVNGAILASLFVLGYDPHATSGIYSGMSDFFGYTIDPRGNIIGVLLAAIIGAQVERKVREYMPDDLDMILTSVVTLLVMGVVTYVVIMPIGGELFKGMSWLFMHLNDNPLGAALLAGLFLIAVVFGIHQGFVPVYFALMQAQGFNSLFPILAMAGAGQVGASLALYVKANKGAVLRTQIKGAIIPGILGIGEPLIYGVTLPRVKPFVTACFGGAAGGFFIGLVSYLGLPVGLNTVFGPSGIVAIPLMTSNRGIFAGMAVFVAGLIVSYIAGFLATYFVGSKNVDLS
ncbi:PTS N-acetylmuramic acid transporter subunit IIBC [Celerinatantimonas diazotrophica]|uniref:PTS system N-acetylmuramic acid-specific EIIBC component n=1 Tax=Celerinatantimonas diazotrophica TaxID=412034 RepID=A0A4V2PND4_9GAMM|nr:PTS N-acetylmuramic acid transporter subunit IIBC [Celerinatantimonas diazotrophica]TCK46661.1 PTS system N-acetylmuramate-specific IIB component (Glc family) /PTS system N-acetylmuramate-specific IIC component (Glc family) [Celerinatantimonas diazotrophica]CAG9295362.1 PTS system N-acetylmuramic acid-specific EIIBC component [Celerinatantimonas diazotrophica]